MIDDDLAEFLIAEQTHIEIRLCRAGFLRCDVRLFDFGRGAATAMILLVILVTFMAFYVGVVMRRMEE